MQTTLSRLDCEGFVRNLQYAVAYWEENRDNFRRMLDELMSVETLQKVTTNATALCLRFNHGKKEIPPEYNQKTILEAYEVLEKKITKDILFAGLNAFMDVIASAPEGVGVPLAPLFSSEFGKEKMGPFVEICMGTDFDVENCYKFFVPQLLMFFIRFLDIYDNALQGALVEDYVKGLPHRIAGDKAEDAEGIKSLWGKMKQQKQEQEKEIQKVREEAAAAGNDTPILTTPADEELPAEHVDQILQNFPQFTSTAAAARRSEREKETQKKAGAKNELHYLERSAQKGWELLLDQWKVRGSDFLMKWRELLDEERTEHLNEARKFLLVMGGGSYASAVLYCPELAVDELAANKGTPFLVLVKKCLADPTATPDDFVQKFLAKLGPDHVEKDKTLTMSEIITVSRRFILLSFVSRVISKVLDIPFTDIAPVTALVQPPTGEKSGPAAGSLFEVQPDLRMCSYPPCEQFETKERSFPVCAYCKKVGRIVPYCSRDCQGKDYPEHKKLCGGAPTTATTTTTTTTKPTTNTTTLTVNKGEKKEASEKAEKEEEGKKEEAVAVVAATLSEEEMREAARAGGVDVAGEEPQVEGGSGGGMAGID